MTGCSKCGSATTRTSYSGNAGEQYYAASCGSCGFSETRQVQTKVTQWTALPLYAAADLPADMDVIAGSNDLGRAYRLPIERILAGGDLNKIQYTLNKRTADIEVPRTQVIPVFVPGPDLPVEKAIAIDEESKAKYLVVSADPNNADNLIIQNTGFLVFPRTHAYQVGKTYYLHQSNPGEVTSVKPASGIVQPLFSVVDELTISINIGV